MTEQPLKTYVAITVEPEPRVFVLEDADMPRRNIGSSPVLHSWLRAGAAGVIGVKFSSWMIKQSTLSTVEKSTVSLWNQSESDFEVFFGERREYDSDADQDDESGHAYLARLDSKTLAICFPIHGSSLGKQDVETLASTLTSWVKPG